MTEHEQTICPSCGYPVHTGHSPTCEKEKITELQRFLEEIYAQDQQDPARTKAADCYTRLKAKEIEFVDTELEQDYWNAVSLELFHMAQTDALQNSEAGSVRKYLSEALEAAEKGFSTEWSAYIQGTACYFKNDIDGLATAIDNSGDNKIVLTRLLNGLRRGGKPNYTEDYLRLENT